MTKTRSKPDDNLSAQDWVLAARAALIRHGVADVKVDRLARELNVTRGSFYWHFADRQALLDALLKQWRSQNTEPFLRVVADDAVPPLEQLARFTRIWLDEKEFDPAYDSAVRDWARNAPEVARAVRSADTARLRVLTQIFAALGYSEGEAVIRARITYYHQVGYYTMRITESHARRAELFPAYFEVLAGQPLPARQ
ncbi:MAG TPA: TetR/AcrR family transcriptional regulator [Noviherbaspirillum sp.]|uniref:TetR/AcrR family transcriptional regulator n=1 Tax=Noviherbaspirillum sp. TaxID=1926288 RepID=UPI002B48A10D|nr:TetR/AcrR family transcriptional regulator [Noviherbaspirillum sp.]HJV86750.1 TetR/AcrR family transcriptional regulator [Noviherbaspirillum sp.]